jgi:hypothetical protein
VFPVDGEPFGLYVRTPIPSHTRTFIKTKSGPVKRADQVFNCPFDIARPVRIFDTEDEHPVVLSCKEEIVEGGSESADVEIPRGTWREAKTDCGHEHLITVLSM